MSQVACLSMQLHLDYFKEYDVNHAIILVG
jgi:hypothetical protein